MPFAVIPNQAERNLLATITHSLVTVKMHLFDNDVTPDPDTVLADFNEASYTGYAAKNWTLPDPTTDGAGKATLAAELFEFFGPTDSIPVDVYGWYVTDSSGSFLFMCGRFTSAPKTLNDATDSAKFDVTPKLFDAHQP